MVSGSAGLGAPPDRADAGSPGVDSCATVGQPTAPVLAPTTIDAFPAEVIEALRKYGASHPGAIISALSSEPGDWLVSESAVAEMLLECHPRSVRRMVLREELTRRLGPRLRGEN